MKSLILAGAAALAFSAPALADIVVKDAYARSAMATASAHRRRPWWAGGLATSNRCNLLGGMPTGARGPRGPGSTVLTPAISLLGLGGANLGR